VVYPYIRDGIHYLKLTRQGRDILTHLYGNVSIVENELMAV